jgi:hypothetical protein
MTTSAQPKRGRGAQHPGPPLGAPATLSVALFVASLFTGPLLGSGSLPSPFSSPAVIQHHFSTSATASQVGGFLLLISAIALAIFTAITWSRLDYLGPNAPGPAICGIGGILASLFLAISALIQWSLSRPSVIDQPTLVRALQYLMFLFGGPAHTIALGLLVFGIAITTRYLHRVPEWLPVVGMVIAVISILSTVTLLVPALAPLIPLGRFTALAWIIAMAALIPRNRAGRGATAGRASRTPDQVRSTS